MSKIEIKNIYKIFGNKPQRVEALIFTGELIKNYIGYSTEVEKVEG